MKRPACFIVLSLSAVKYRCSRKLRYRFAVHFGKLVAWTFPPAIRERNFVALVTREASLADKNELADSRRRY
jgi:hypothetical protein